MEEKTIKGYLIDFHKKELPNLVERDIIIPDSKKIKTIIGPRRAGKTYFMFQEIKKLIKKGISKKNIIYLNFEDPRLIDITFKDIRKIIIIHFSLFPQSRKRHLFIDEPQNIERWEIAIRSLYDEGFNIFLSGSNSKLLSKEIATSLRGRTITYVLLPFSFKEFLRYNEFDLPQHIDSYEKAKLVNFLDQYIEFGGFPEIIREKIKDTKLRIIDEYFNLVVYKDLVERYKIKNTNLVRWMIKSLVDSYSKEFSVNKLFLILKSKGIKLSKNTLYSYLSMLQDSMFVFLLQKFDYSIRKKEFSIQKAYLNDIVFTKLSESSKSIGKKIENIVFLELVRKKKPLSEIYFWQNQQKEEVDFVIKDRKIKQLIQVCYDIDDYDTKKREIRVLIKAGRELKCNNLIIINWTLEKKQKVNGKTIQFIPLWKWLLEN